LVLENWGEKGGYKVFRLSKSGKSPWATGAGLVYIEIRTALTAQSGFGAAVEKR
jgi:hypothetical protein